MKFYLHPHVISIYDLLTNYREKFSGIMAVHVQLIQLRRMGKENLKRFLINYFGQSSG